MKSDPFDPSRRQFVRKACCAAVGATGILSAMAQLRLIGAMAADSSPLINGTGGADDYKALVCLYLNGGNDACSMLVPYDSNSYGLYATARDFLAIDQAKLLPISLKKYQDGRSYALHPAMPSVHDLYGNGNLAFLANVGTLCHPTTLREYRAGLGLPSQLFSHADQTSQWQSSIPDKPFTTGWGGRLADLIETMNSNNQISMSITLSGTNSFQIGEKVVQFAVNEGGVIKFEPGSGGLARTARSRGREMLLNIREPNLLEAAFGSIAKSAKTDSDLLLSALAGAPRIGTRFPGTPMARKLHTIAQLISVAPKLGLRRQVFFCQLVGFDTHGDQVASHEPLLTEVSEAMGAFYRATAELGVADRVTTFTASDFGRTYNPNGSGTDHGWGNHQLIMGGAVQGGDIYGRMPSLQIGGMDDTGRGRWIPSTSVDEYSATLASWFGVSKTALPAVLPNIGRFAHPNLGFFG